eukprot:gene10104-11780_t
MKIKKPSIAIDMDGVIADTESHFITWYYKDYGVLVNRAELFGKPESEAFPNKEAVLKFVHSPGFFRTLPVMAGAVEVIQELMKDFEIYIVSAAMEFPQSLSEKKEWLQEHFPFISWKNIVFCGDKSIIDTDYMIDDHFKNLDFCKGKAILFHAAHNATTDRHQRVHSWEDVKSLLQKELAALN